MACPGTGLPVNIRWERTRESTLETVKCMTGGSAFGNNVFCLPNLSAMTFNFDRGYIAKKLSVEYFFPARTELNGTLKRCGWNIFTWDKKTKRWR